MKRVSSMLSALVVVAVITIAGRYVCESLTGCAWRFAVAIVVGELNFAVIRTVLPDVVGEGGRTTNSQ